MRTFVKYIGVTDKNDNVHAVTLKTGVNIITGRSSTGKSALIEIFDFCFGSSDFTVPEGVITECAKIYFVVIQVGDAWLVLARQSSNEQHGFIKMETDDSVIQTKDSFISEYFEDEYFVPMGDFKKILRSYFGQNIQITDIDESVEERNYRGNRKKSTPSIRSFTSYMLQHQNLIANKHAIFYRFDEKEKREQTIDHFKVFVGFAGQEYFLKLQELEILRNEERKLSLQIPRQSEIKDKKKMQISEALKEYTAISGKSLNIGNLDVVVSGPQIALDKIRSHRTEVVSTSDEHAKLKADSERKLSELTAKYRKQQNIIKDIESSIQFAENYHQITGSIDVPDSAKIHASQCPFCKSYYDSIEQQANNLSSAINWLNEEMEKSYYSLESFREDLLHAKEELQDINSLIKSEQTLINQMEKQIKDLERYKTQHELAIKVKLKIESYLEELLEKPTQELEERLNEIKTQIKDINKLLKDKYNVDMKMKEAETKIAKYMAEIASSLDFEDSYKPVKLKFSLDTFDLWNEKGDKKIFLRSMGSGANWLSCHISLFLGLNNLFCELDEQCAIPTTMFFDQPSQVYFPSVLDSEEVFSAEDIAKKEGQSRTRDLDDDIKAVTELYSEFVRYCYRTKESTGIEPQLIITDHADNLDLADGIKFETFVRARWRAEGAGFIQR